MKLQAVLEVLRSLAPEHLAEPWDHVGLQVGDPAWPVRRAMLCIDLTERVLAEAIDQRVSLIVAYHPPIFSPLDAVTSLDPKQRLVLQAARHKIAIYTPHTALDASVGGVNDWLCEAVGAGQRCAAVPSGPSATRYKLVTFVPSASADGLAAALARAGAGVIGNYTHCSFRTAGEGTFRGGASTRPAVGQRGRLERVEELRMEWVVDAGCLTAVIGSLRQSHPYEEPAFDLYRLESPPCPGTGQGRVVTLDQPTTAAAVVKCVKQHLGVERLEVAVGDRTKPIHRVGLCAGAGGSLLGQIAPVDAFITGEMRHHDVLAAHSAGVMVVLAGHTQTERPYLRVYRRRIIAAAGRSVAWLVAKCDRPPSRWQ